MKYLLILIVLISFDAFGQWEVDGESFANRPIDTALRKEIIDTVMNGDGSIFRITKTKGDFYYETKYFFNNGLLKCNEARKGFNDTLKGICYHANGVVSSIYSGEYFSYKTVDTFVEVNLIVAIGTKMEC